MKQRVLLVRHTAVAVRWATRCYGHTDVGLSRAGRRSAAELAQQLAARPVTAVVHSGLERTAHLARAVAGLSGLVPIVDARWRERNFATWEGRGWHSIWKETGNAMDGMLTDPGGYRPGGGETTAELAARSIAAWHALPQDGLVIVVSHGGPIAAVRAQLAGARLTDIVRFRVPSGSIVTTHRRRRS